MLTVQEQKKELRQQIKSAKKLYSENDLLIFSNEIFNKLESLNIFQYSSIILCYWSIAGEVFTHDFIKKWYQKKMILLPGIAGENLILKKFNGFDKLITGENFNILEPSGQAYTDWEKIDIAIIPGIAFDKNNNRLGRGKAFYDKLLTGLSAFRIGVCFKFQYFESIPINKHDIKMDMVIYD